MTTLALRPRVLLDGPDHVAIADDEDVAVGIRHLERTMWLAGDDGGHWETLRPPLVVDGIDILDHQVPTNWTRSDLLRVVSDRKVRPAPHLKHSEVLSHLDGVHADPFIEARCDCRVVGTKGDVTGPNRRTKIRRIRHEDDGTPQRHDPAESTSSPV